MYAHFDTLLVALPSLNTSEKIALKVSRLRMSRNDGLPLSEASYFEHISILINDLHHLSAQEQVVALAEIFDDVGFELDEARKAGDREKAVPLIRLLFRVGAELKNRHYIIVLQLESIPTTLVAPRQKWLNFRNRLIKIEVMQKLEASDESPLAELNHMLSGLKEMAELYQAKQAYSDAIEAWLVLVDEFMAYTRQPPPAQWQEQLVIEWEARAQHALEEASSLMVSLPHWNGLEDKMIGLAYSELVLNNDLVNAKKWIGNFDESGCSLHHLAAWLRNHYYQVKSAA